MQMVVVQFAGDFREVVASLGRGEPESYYAQEYSVKEVVALTKVYDSVISITFNTETIYDEVLDCGVRAIGIGYNSSCTYQTAVKNLLKKLHQIHPSHILLRTPIPSVINWSISTKALVACTFADSFQSKGLKQRVKNWLLARSLNHPNIKWVANHGIAASESLRDIGVKVEKIVPWDWPQVNTPSNFPPKKLTLKNEGDNNFYTIFYIGVISKEKGVWDLIDSVSLCVKKGLRIKLRIAGKGMHQELLDYVGELGLAKHVEYLGLIPNVSVINRMQQADAVVIPSRKTYPEGFPLTIYETLCSRTPLIASNHPMFSKVLIDQYNSLVFEAGNSQNMATCIQTLFSDEELYSRLSNESEQAWINLQLPITWGVFIKEAFLEGCPSDLLKTTSLATNFKKA